MTNTKLDGITDLITNAKTDTKIDIKVNIEILDDKLLNVKYNTITDNFELIFK